jgi:hypothetical protein
MWLPIWPNIGSRPLHARHVPHWPTLGFGAPAPPGGTVGRGRRGRRYVGKGGATTATLGWYPFRSAITTRLHDCCDFRASEQDEAADEGLQQEVGEPVGRSLPALRLVHFLLRPHNLRVTPAMEAGITDHVWEIAALLGLARSLCSCSS